jgi:hypothetical protein
LSAPPLLTICGSATQIPQPARVAGRAFFVRADGVTTGRLRRNVAGVLISTLDTDQELYDSTRFWRERAMTGVLHNGSLPEPIDEEAVNPL